MKTIAARNAQYPLVIEFIATFKDWVVDSIDGSKKTLGSAVAASADPNEPKLLPGTGQINFNCINLPAGAVIHGGDVIIETGFVGSVTPISRLGTAANITQLGSFPMTAVGRTALTLTGVNPLAFVSGLPVLATMTTTGTATAGKVRVRLEYTIEGRANEVQPA